MAALVIMTPLTMISILSMLLSVCMGSQVNITIDDEVGDTVGNGAVSYLPVTNNVWAEGSDCQTCDFHPNANGTFDGSWHDATYIPQNSPNPPTMTLLFPGSAIYVYCVLVNQPQFGIQTLTNLSFTMDGLSVGTFLHQPTGSNDFLYNQSVYSNTNTGSAASLPGGRHNLTITVYANILFDYAIYTETQSSVPVTSSPSSTSLEPPSRASSSSALIGVLSNAFSVGTPSNKPTAPSNVASSASASASTSIIPITHKSNVGAVAGGAVGGIAALAILAAVIFVIFKRRSRPHNETNSGTEEPKDSVPGIIVEPFILPDRLLLAPHQPASVSVPSLAPPASSTMDDSQPRSEVRGKMSHSTIPTSPYSENTYASNTDLDVMRELQDRLQEMQSRLDRLQDTRSQGSSRLDEEITALREHVARLEAHRFSLWSSSDPPPEYERQEESRDDEG